MAPRNSMRTKTWSLERTTFPLTFGQNGRGAQAYSQSQWRSEPRTKAKKKVESRNNIVYSLFELSKHIYYLI